MADTTEEPDLRVPNLWHETLAPHQQAVLRAQLRRHRAFRVLAVMLGLALLVTVMLWWLSPIPHPYFAGLWLGDNESKQIPLLFQVNRDREALRDGNYFRRTSPRAFQNLDREGLLRELNDLSQRSPADAVVIYLSGHARTGPQGDVQVLPADANLGNPQSWVPLRDVLERIKACPSRRKLLVLDIMAPMALPRLGVPADEVSAAVPNDLEAVKDPYRLVLCPCSPGQSALASPDMGRTVFSYYFEEALRGWADGYGGKGPDRRVSVREATDFVKARVDRWTWQNRQVRQTPVLYGDANDFDLIVVAQGKPQPHLGSVDAPEYPTWLADNWKTRDKWWAEETYRTVPHLARELDVALLATEKEWVNGVDLTAGRENRPLQIKGITARKELFRFPPQPDAYSLSLLEAQGRKPDAEVLAQLREVVYKQKAPAKDKGDKTDKADKADPAAEKAKLDVLEQVRAKPHVEVALAAWDLVSNDPEPQPERIVQLNTLLQQQEVRPRYVETLFLQRLAAIAAEANWPRESVQQALNAARLSERATSQIEAVDWIRPLLDEMSQRRHEGDTLFFARGYAPTEQAEPLLLRAATVADQALAFGTTIRRARRTLDEALAFLPAAVPYVERLPRYQRDWSEAVQIADELYQAFAVADIDALTTDQRRQRVDDIRGKTDELQQRLIDLRRPFVPTAWANLKDAATRPDAGVFHFLEIDTLLAVPFLKAEDRLVLMKAYQGLSRRLHDATRKIDDAEDAKSQSVTTKFSQDGDAGRRASTESDRALLRTRMTIDLLRLAGIPAEELTKLDAGLVKAQETGASDLERRQRWYALGQQLRLDWLEVLPDRVGRSASMLLRDRVSRVYCGPELGQPANDSDVTPQVTLQQQESRKLWSWLADRYRYLSRDGINLGQSPGGAPALYAAAARAYQQAVGTLPEEEYVEMTGPGVVDLAAGTATRYPMQLRVYTPSQSTDATLRLMTADDVWLRVAPEDPRDASGKLSLPHLSARKVPLRVDVNPDAARQGVPPPRGFLAEVVFNNRSYHHLVPLGLQSVSERVEILLSTNPNQPTNPAGELRLRPVKPRQPYYLYVSNPTGRARNLVVQLAVADVPLPNAEAKLVLGPKETRRVAFPQPAAPQVPAAPPGTPAAPLPDLPDLTGPLEIRVTDTDTKLTERKLVAVGVASPREYVQVTNIQYNPGTDKGKNRLSVSLRSLLAGGPPCLAELVLPPDRIPGLLAPPEGNLRGEVPPGGAEELKLYAEGLLLRPDAEEDGHVYLNIDTLPRAFVFRTTFVRDGEPTTPREDNSPALRIRAPRFGITGQKLPVDVEADNAPPGSRLDISIGTMVAGLFEPETTRRLPTAQETRVGFSPAGEGGALVFEAMMRDWHVEMDTLRIKGRRWLMARLTDASGQAFRTAFSEVTLDDSPADKVRIVDAPAKWRKDVALAVKAQAAAPVAGVKEVNFFFGRPVDNKLPPNTPTFPAQPANDARTEWTAKIPLAGERKGPTDLSVEFKSMTGLSSFGTTSIEFTEPDAPAEVGKIEGTVAEGPRVQGALTVVLRNEKNEVQNQTTTEADGSYKFENVKPGKYKVTAAKPTAKRKAEKSVEVAPGATVRLDLALGV